MRSLKNIARASLAIVFISIGIAIIANFTFLQQMREFIYQSSDIIERSRSELNEMEIAIRVLNNITGVVLRDGEDSLSENQIGAYHDNQVKMLESSKAFNERLIELGATYSKINRWSFGRHDDLISQLNQVIVNIQHDLMNHDTNFSHMESTVASHESMRDSFKQLTRLNLSLNETALKDISIIINILVFTLIVIIAFLGLGISKFVNKDLPFIMKSLSQIESNQYDVSQLPITSPKFAEQKEIVKYIEEIMNERKFTLEIRDILSEHLVVDDVVTALFELIQDRIKIDRIGVAFVDYNKQKIIAEFGIAQYDTVLLGPGFEVGFDQTSLSRILEEKTTRISNDVEREHLEKPKSPSLRLIRREGIQSNMIIPLISSGTVFGMVFFSSLEKNHFKEKEQKLAEKIIYEISGLLNKSYFTKVVLSKFTASFAQIVESKDNDTGEHIERMVQYAVIIANGVREKNHPEYQITKREILEIERYASAHDIGKVGIPDGILKKPGKLTPEEWVIMKTHVTIGADVFAELRKDLRYFDEDLFKTAEEIVRYHHEKWDGSGYPHGLSGSDIPLSARIVALSDVFDALSSKRVYKSEFDFEASVAIIEEGRGKHFDPFVVDCFLDKLGEIRVVYDNK